MLGVDMLNSGKTSEALNIFKKILKFNPQDNDLLQKAEYEVADCYAKLGQDKEALTRFKFLRAKYPDSKLTPEILWWLGQYYYRSNDPALARRYLGSLTSDFKDSRVCADAFYLLGLMNGDEDRFAQAQDDLRLAIKQGGPELKRQAAIELADIYNRQGKTQDALNAYKDILDESPDLASLLYPKIAEGYYKAQDYEQAKVFYQKSLSLLSGDDALKAEFDLAEVLEAEGETDEAVAEYLKVADAAEKNTKLSVRALLRAANIYEDKDNFKEAAILYNRVIDKKTEEASFARERIDWIRANANK